MSREVVSKVRIVSTRPEPRAVRVFINDQPIDSVVKRIEFSWDATQRGDNEIVLHLTPRALDIDVECHVRTVLYGERYPSAGGMSGGPSQEE